MYSVYIDNKIIDTFNTDNIVLNAILFDISAPANRGLQFSNRINLPKTEKNIAVFKFFDNDVSHKEYTADIYEDTTHIICGTVKVIELVKYIQIQIVEVFKQVSENLKIPMYNLDLSDEDFIYNMTNYNIVKNNTTDCVSWELVDNRYNQAIDNIKGIVLDPNISIFRPHFNVLNLIKKIFDDQGYTVDTSDLDTRIDDLRMLSNAQDFWIAFYQSTQTSTTLTAGVPLPMPLSGASVQINWDEFSPFSKDFDPVFSTGFYILSAPDHHVNNTKYVMEIDIDEEAEVSMIKRDFASSAYSVIEKFRVVEKGIFITKELEHEEFDGMVIEFIFDVDITINQIRFIALAKESEIYITGAAWTWNDGSSLSGWKRIPSSGPLIAMLDAFYFKAQYNLPDWTQFEFLKEVWTMLNVSIKIEGTEIIFKDNSLTDFVNITDYVVDRVSLKGNFEYARRNIFRYADDGSEHIKEYDAKINEKIFIEMKSDASEDAENEELTNPYSLGLARIYDKTSPINTEIDDRKQVNERFFLSTANDYPLEINADKKLIFEGLSFDDLYEDYYADYYDYLQDSKVMTYNIKIGYPTFINIINSGKIYDSILGRELTVLNISKYNSNKLTTIIAVTREI